MKGFRPICIYPNPISGFSYGWYMLEDDYVISFGNCKTREMANEMLKRERPDCELINVDWLPNMFERKKWEKYPHKDKPKIKP